MARPSARDRLFQLLWAAGWIVAVWFAVQGGEYSTLDLVRQQRLGTRLARETDSLTRVVDSLKRLKQRVLTDPATQERIAREQFGMVRGNELLYRIVEPSSDPKSKSP